MRRRSLREFLIRLETAKRRIWLTTPYLAPTAAVLRSLGVAARNGADVRILVPRKSDVFFMPWIANAFYSPLLADGVRIYEYLPRFLHAKSVIVDDWAVVGTSNMNRRSLIHDLEVDVVLQHPNSLQDLSQEFLVDLRCSEEIKKPASLFRRLVGQLLSRLLRDII
jgi:cardiolipin synthase